MVNATERSDNDQSTMQRTRYRMGRVQGAQFEPRAFDVGTQGVFGNLKGVRDLTAGMARGQQSQNIGFPRRQVWHGLWLPVGFEC